MNGQSTDYQYRGLATAILLRAFKDYYTLAKREYKTKGELAFENDEILFIEKCLKSDWGSLLKGDLDVELILKDIKIAIRNDTPLFRRNKNLSIALS